MFVFPKVKDVLPPLTVGVGVGVGVGVAIGDGVQIEDSLNI